MERKTLAITAPPLLSAMFFHLRGAFSSSKVLGFLLLLSCLLLPLTASEPCSVNALHNPAECDSCGSPGYNPVSGFQDFSVGDASSSYAAETRQSVQSVCTSSHSFCFLSSLGSGNQSDPFYSLGQSNPSKSWSDRNWTSDYDVFELMDGRKVACSLSSRDETPLSASAQSGSANKNSLSASEGSLLKNKKDGDAKLNDNPGMTKSDSSGDPSFSVEINPPVLDWGEKFVFFPSVAFLTVENKCNNSILHVYEPFSSDKQFYPCNNTGFLLSPGEVASVCFMFLPRWLGLSSAHLVLQTNRGGFLVQAKGFAVKSLYGAQPLVSIAIPANPWSMKTFSVFNPLNEPLFVEGVIAWISISSENSSLHTEVNCLVENHDSPEILPLGIKDQLIVKSNGLGAFQMVAVKPYGSWEIGPGKREDILEMELLPNFEGRISGTVSLQLLRSSKEQIDTIIFPLEVDLGKKIAWNDPRALVSVFLEPLVSYDDAEMTMAISLKNDAPYMLAVVNVSKVADTSLFHIKHNKGLLLFPGSVTQVALISCAQLPSAVIEASDINNSCVVLVLTNDSSNPEVEILCRDVFHICSRNKKDSSNKKSGPSGSGMSSSSQVKALERAHSDDELILGNWKSQGIRSNLSVLKEHEVTFPVVQVGTHGSRYITVKNPSHEPVVMQFVLNSGEIIDECKGQDSIHFSQFNGSVARKGSELGKNAFSVAENAVTEAYVYPSSELTFGPIHFHPSNRCRWRSSALIRNNLSGVEWISLKGLGGSLSLILLEKSEPVHTIEFQPDVPSSLGMSPMCYKPLSKVLYAKNTGDFPLEIQSISVSGTKCGGDGFVVHQCKSFSLEPGESSSFHLSYHMDLSASTVNRDLEFVSESGVILAVPLKASIPVLMLNLCKKSVFSVRLKKFSMAVLLAAASLFLLLYFVFPQMTAIISHDHRFYESSKRSCNRVAIRRAAEKSSSHYQEKHNGFTISPEMDSLLRSMREDTLGRMNNGKDEVSAEAEQSRKLTPASGSAPEPVNLTVKTVRDKKKRRKKKKGVVTMRLMEVSSSHSGNSTPTSPISPAISATPETDDHPFRRVEPPGSGPPRAAKPSVLSHSATFPCTATRSVTIGRSSSPLAPSARAPGAKLGGKESVKRKEEMWYDMWGDHLKGLNLMDKFKEVRAGKSSGLAEDADDDSDSFFVKGPQSFLTNSHPRYVSFFSP